MDADDKEFHGQLLHLRSLVNSAIELLEAGMLIKCHDSKRYLPKGEPGEPLFVLGRFSISTRK